MQYQGPMFVGKGRIRYRWRGVKLALRCLWNAFRGFEMAGWAYGTSDQQPASAEPEK